jgi:acyl carrier protein
MKTISFEARRARQTEGEVSSTAAVTDPGAADIPSSIAEPLAQIWCAVLRVNSTVVEVEDNFFELGGTSLHAMLLASRIQTTLGIEISLIDFFDDPTFGTLARSCGGEAPA